ncbi:MAG TPA: hypothetical protein VEA37_01460 [Flavobacterium sp.]|nr:hypothetical protein [Flavobacterium sp.]
MNKEPNAGNGQGSQGRPNREMNRTNDNRRLKEDMDLTQDNQLPYPDPAEVNPEELATFPKKSQQSDPAEVENERESHLVNKRSPLREGRNITRTDNNPDTDGFM